VKSLKQQIILPEATLSKQEKKVLELILEDKSNKEIANEMFVSLSTVKSHINNLYKKLNVSSREEVKQQLTK
jgi:ATP/maltotriose-dependent transcriptional regulator MalT